MKKISFFLLLIFFYLIHYKTASAYVCSVYGGGTCDGYDLVGYDYCGYFGSTVYCDKGESDCPHCTSDSGCCSGADSWTMYQMECAAIPLGQGFFNYVYVFIPTSQKVYSTGDKVDKNGSSLVFDSSNCSGQQITPYKACCNKSTGQLVPYNTYDDDGIWPDEAMCDGTGGSTINNGYGYLSESDATSICAAYAPQCSATCYTTPNGEDSCSDYDGGGSVYSPASGECSDPDWLCCSISYIGPTPTLVPTQRYWYCKTSDTCYQTAAYYETDAAGVALCETNLGLYIPGTTGVCYADSGTCNSNCAGVTGTPTPSVPTGSCIPWTCPPSPDGECGSAENNIYSSSAPKPVSGLCSEGSPSTVTKVTVGSHSEWRWTCYAP